MNELVAQLSNPFSTGGGGNNFECHVQSVFVVLMMAGGVAPCVPAWPIKRIKLQGKCAGFNTDDCIVFVQNRVNGQEAKLLAQIKHAVAFTERDQIFAEVVAAGLADFPNAQYFNEKTDAIALVTTSLSGSTIQNVRSLLELARHCENSKEFMEKVGLAKFTSDAQRDKLRAFRVHLKNANQGVDVSDDEIWRFLKRFHLLNYDLDVRSGADLSLVHSLIGQFQDDVQGVWSKVNEDVRSHNQNAGTLTWETVGEEVRQAFSKRVTIASVPLEVVTPDQKTAEKKQPLLQGEQADALAMANLLGGFNDKKKGDLDTIKKLVGGND